MTKLACTVLALAGAFSLGAGSASAQEFPGNPSFKLDVPILKQLASLGGCWVGKNPWGEPARVTYDLASDGTVIMEYLEQRGQVPMYSAIYIDGDTPMIHHFCSYGSQIRFRAEPQKDPNVINFAFLDATNIKSREADDHMTSITFIFKDKDHLDIDWGLHQHHKDLRQLFPFTRVVEGCDVRHSDVWH